MAQGGMVIVKYLLFFFNFVFVITGIALIAVGGVAKRSGETYFDFLGHNYSSPVVLVIVVGVLVFILAFLGCCGAVKENYCMLMTFSVLLSLIFILELAGGIAAYVFRNKLESEVRDNMYRTLKPDAYNTTYVKVWDDVQNSLHCCGVENSTDWARVFLKEDLLPLSCCNETFQSEQFCNGTLAYRKGCLTALEDYIMSNVSSIGAAGVVIAFIELIGVVFGCCLAYTIRKTYEVV